MVQQSPVPTFRTVIVAILDDGAFRPTLLVILVSSRDHIPCYTKWRLLRLLATITRYTIFSKLSHRRHSSLRLSGNGLLFKSRPFSSLRTAHRLMPSALLWYRVSWMRQKWRLRTANRFRSSRSILSEGGPVLRNLCMSASHVSSSGMVELISSFSVTLNSCASGNSSHTPSPTSPDSSQLK